MHRRGEDKQIGAQDDVITFERLDTACKVKLSSIEFELSVNSSLVTSARTDATTKMILIQN